MSDFDLFNQEESFTGGSSKPVATKIPNGEYLHTDNFFSKKESDHFFEYLKQNVYWQQESMNIYGKKVLFPRLTAWYGDNDKAYTFSGITLNPNPWFPDLMKIKNKIEKIALVDFNSVLLNMYRDGNDSISWHSDSEPELGKNPVIASVNFGDSRIFQLKHKLTKEKIELELTHGSILIMQGELQHFWVHQVPKTKLSKKERINLTFRVIK